jgi:hypothetical protein
MDPHSNQQFETNLNHDGLGDPSPIRVQGRVKDGKIELDQEFLEQHVHGGVKLVSEQHVHGGVKLVSSSLDLARAKWSFVAVNAPFDPNRANVAPSKARIHRPMDSEARKDHHIALR